MLLQRKWQQIFTIALVTLGTAIIQSGWCDAPATDNPTLSESTCLKLFEESIVQAQSGNWQNLKQKRQIFKQCRVKFAPPPNPNAPL